MQQLAQSAPLLLKKLNDSADSLKDVLNAKNRKALSDVLANLDTMTTALAKRSDDIDATLANFSIASKNLAAASDKISPTLVDADASVKKLGKLSDDADAFVKGDGLAQVGDPAARDARAGREPHGSSPTSSIASRPRSSSVTLPEDEKDTTPK